VTSLAEDQHGNLLIGTRNGVYLYATCPTCRRRPVLLGNDAGLYARVVFVDRTGSIWIGTDNDGLARYSSGRILMYTTRDGLGSDAVRAIAEDSSGALWIGTKGGGLHRFEDGRFVRFSRQEGLPDDNVYAILVEPRASADGTSDVLWCATRHGLVRWKDGRFQAVTIAQGLHANFVYNITSDDRGYFWMSCSTGIFCVSRSELNDVVDGRRRAVTSVAYGLEHGLGGIVGTIGHHPGAFKASDGRIWFATADGVAAVQPGELPRDESVPAVLIEELEADQKPVPVREGVRLRPGRGDLTFRYTGLSLLAPDKMQFRYKLEGYDPDWREAGTRRVAYYTNISPGDYTFRVIARNNDGEWNKSGATLEVHLAPPFYRTRLFLVACVAALVLLIVGVHQVRVRTIAAQKKRLEVLVSDRTRELSTASRQLDLANRDLERRVAEGIEALREAERMAAYGQLIAAVAHEVRHPVFALQAASHVLRDRLQLEPDLLPQLRTLESETNRLNVLMGDLLDFARPPELHLASATATDLFAETVDVFHDEGHAGVRVVIDVEPGLPRLHVDRFRLIQALLNLMRNAVNHAGGLTRLTLAAHRPPDARFGVRLSVGDDGSGIRPELLTRVFEPFVTCGKGTGLGLSIARGVATAHGGQVSVDSELGQGSTFHLDLPASDEQTAAAAS
jgi:signal transduction histidine kinase